MKKILNLKDTAFSHLPFSAPGLTSEKMEWDRTCKSDAPTFYTHEQIYETTDNDHPKYALLLESRAIIPGIYNSVDRVAHKFDKIFTHSSEILKKYTNARWIPGGSCWIGGEYGGGEIKVYPKTKLCSMVCSDKRMCSLHNLRIAIAEFLQTQNTGIDFYGSLFGQWVPIIDSLQDYMFSICIENYVDSSPYFTEKLLNCFAIGTIPIYLGSSDLSRIFNTDGILQFQKPGQLLDLLAEYMTPEFYHSKLSAVQANFETCKQFRLLEDYICEKYL